MPIGAPRKGFNVIAYNDQKRRRQEREQESEMTIQHIPDNYFGLEMSSGAAHALYRIAANSKIEAIAMVRWKTGMGLVEAKNWLEGFVEKFKKMTKNTRRPEPA